MLSIVEDNFREEVEECNSEVFLIFSSERCSYCRDLKRLIKVLQRVITDVKFCFADVDCEPQLASRYSVTQLPLSVVFENGKEKARKSGALTKSEIYSLLGRRINVVNK